MPNPIIVEERNVNQEEIESVKTVSLKLISSIEELKRQIKEGNQMVDDTLTEDAAYMEAAGKAETATKQKTWEKKRVQSRPEMIELSLNIKAQKDELKEKRESLSNFLIEYDRMSGANVIETVKGEQLTIFKTAKAAKAK